ncbi:MAG: hypothetical protein PQJ59_14000 [Spirochaetales bacterium]|nr:hypothetical protein [Spirochaetales bacterium]
MIEPIKQKKISPSVVVFLIRWWTAGAVMYFIGWGTALGQYDNSIDLIFGLGTVYGLIQSYILGPVFKMLYNIGPVKDYKELSYGRKFLWRVSDVSLGIVTVVFVYAIFVLLNTVAVALLEKEAGALVVPVEPILFGFFFSLVTLLFTVIGKQIGKIKQNIRGREDI